MVRFLIATIAALTCFSTESVGQTARYIGSDQCIECHQKETAAWKKSHHAKAWTEVGEETVLADFDETKFQLDGMRVEFSKEAQKFIARVTELEGETTEYPVHSVVGIEPLQQYLIETETGKLQSFDVVWDTEKKEWFHLYPDQDLPPDDGLHWTGPYKNWNGRCAECHATGFQKNFGARTGRYASQQSEIGVGCEACHGPASEHIEWVQGKALADGVNAYGFSMSWGKGNTEAEIQQCAGCHSRREAFEDGNPLPGTSFHDAYNLALLRPGLYHPDGQIQDEVYVYGSFLQSRMYAQGVGCMNCHEPHSAELRAEGNAVCTQCHSPAGNPEFPTLALKEYDSVTHHQHAEGSEGAQCKNCHMIERVYMGVDGRRDHSFRVPRPDIGPSTGSPDACTDCHNDRDQKWAARQIEIWYPDSVHRQKHFGETFSAAISTPADTSEGLIEIALDGTNAGIVRATALYLLQQYSTPEIATNLAELLSDEDPLVRASAAPLQRQAEVSDRVERLVPLLQDEKRSVRISAAKEFLPVPPEVLTPSQKAMAGQGMDDWRRSMSNRLDFPETHLVLGGMALTLRNAEAAERAFREV
ncbi:MAG: multiheme c-type cytochrome, partial [Ruegeria sp.]